MEYAALAVALLALIVALSARAKAGGSSKAIEDATADARRRIENANAERERELDVLRKTLVMVARNEQVSDEMILEGRLWRDVNTQDGIALVTSGRANVVDVRTRQEMAAGIIPGALLIPLDELEARAKEIPRNGRTTIVYCASGGRSASACEYLSREGFENLVNLESGFSGWNGPSTMPGVR
ncbi:MAG: rhodanese-like domain-containing protein [Planctomycetes bacterium]|nr:rhodanese-like domain-containing protein [Planctomycetota bacterium]